MSAVPGKNGFRRREIAWIIGVEKRIVGLNWPLHNGAAVVLQECLDLSHILYNECVAEAFVSPNRAASIFPICIR
jgi:hypothetical protein